jgi:hypothetical protein
VRSATPTVHGSLGNEAPRQTTKGMMDGAQLFELCSVTEPKTSETQPETAEGQGGCAEGNEAPGSAIGRDANHSSNRVFLHAP